MTLYCVFQEGVYRHDCEGVYDTFEAAVEAANSVAADDRDDYHNYEVTAYELNQRPLTEKILYSVNKTEALNLKSGAV